MCCAWLAAELTELGFVAEDERTAEIIWRWRGVPVSSCAEGRSAQYLRRSNQLHDLEFVLTHVNDLDELYQCVHGEVVKVSTTAAEYETGVAA
jgi:2-phosphosulfolactate phosphatase